MIRNIRGHSRGRKWLRAGAAATAAGVATVGLLAAVAPAQAAATEVSSGSLDWGVRQSFRSYIASPVAHGTITVGDGATQKPSNGTFVFSGATGTVDASANTAAIELDGKVKFDGHDGQLQLEISNPSIAVNASSAVLSAHVVSKSLSTGQLTDYGTIAFANFAVGAGSSLGTSTVINGTSGKLTNDGVAAFSNFYLPPDNDFVDDFSLNASLVETPAPATPTVTVSKTEVNAEGETITVTGTGFDPNAAIGTRPPLNGKPAGVYVAFGTFLDNWRPSAGAPSSARKTAPQGTSVRWAVLEADRATVGQAASVTLNPNGSFTAELFVERDFAGALAEGNYGIYTYPGSGAVNASFETYTPLTFVEPLQPNQGQQTITTQVLDNLGLSIKIDDDSVTLPSPTLSADGEWLETAGALNPVQVTDLRGTDPGWTLSGQLTDFVSGSNTAPANSLGWSPKLIASQESQQISLGSQVQPNAVGGLSGSSTLAVGAANAGRGKATVGADLQLKLPVLTVPGTYVATLTLTAI